MEILEVQTGARCQLVEITGRVRDVVKKTGVTDGICVVYSPHTTAGIVINEHADPAVCQDIDAELERMIPPGSRFAHLEGNSPAHVKASLVGTSVTLVVSGGEVRLGTWQGIFFAEFDGPRRRSVWIKVMG